MGENKSENGTTPIGNDGSNTIIMHETLNNTLALCKKYCKITELMSRFAKKTMSRNVFRNSKYQIIKRRAEHQDIVYKYDSYAPLFSQSDLLSSDAQNASTAFSIVFSGQPTTGMYNK